MNDRAAKPFLGLRALLVDDIESARDILQGILERMGFSVITASDGPQAIEIAQKSPGSFDVAMIDMVMSRLDGVSTIRQISEILSPASVPLIPMSASITPEIEQSCIQAGAYPATLRKPYRAAQVSTLLAQALNRDLSTSGEQPVWAQRIDGLSLDGCDIEGAMDRCGGDAKLYLKLIDGFLTEGSNQVGQAIYQLKSAGPKEAVITIQNLRGVMLNLGLVDLVAQVLAVLDELLPAGSSADTANLAQGGERFARQIEALGNLDQELRATLEKIQHMLVLNQDSQAPESDRPGETGQETDESFTRLAAQLSDNDPAALALIDRQGNLLPERYDRGIQEQFRSHAEGLDFEAALKLLRPEDLPENRRNDPQISADSFRILVVDDAAITVRLMCRVLEGMGSLRFALSGEKALEIANRWLPDVLISDVSMSGMSGIELCRQIKSVPQLSDCVVMLISASDDVAVEVEALTAGATDFIEKPLNAPRIVGRVSAQLAMLRRRAEGATLQAELAHDSATGFITCDVTGQVLGISPALARWLERPPNPAPGLLAQDLFEPAFFSTLDRAIRTHRRGERIGPFETSATSAAGARLPVRLIGREMPGQRSRVLWFGIEDISARVRSERLRTDAQLTEKLGVLASGIAHEFNNLLGVIIGRIDMAIDLNKDEKVAPHLERASEAAVRAATISNGLRGSAEQQSLRAVGTFSLATLLEQYWPLLRNLVPSSIAFEREAFDANLSISVDPNDFLGILMRIVENAAEASSPGDRIVVRARSEGLSDASPNSRRVLLEIQDVGVGMSRDAVSRAFEAFFTTKAPAHVGLGLSEVASMAERNHASVSIQSSPGMGSTVQVEFAAA